MSSHDGRARGLPPALGWFSLALGAAQLVVPGAVNRLIGVRPTGANRTLTRAIGLRELAAGIGIITREPSGFLRARVAGDAVDLALLSNALRSDGAKSRTGAALVAVGGVTALDITAVRARSQRRDRRGQMKARSAITVNASPATVYAEWRDLERLPTFMYHLESVTVTDDRRSHWVAKGPAGTTVSWDAEIVEDIAGERLAWRSVEGASVENAGEVRFSPAPGGRATEVHVELTYAPPAGTLGALVAKLFGENPAQQVSDDLRRFKQLIETGEIARSEGSPLGSRTTNQARQRDAQPLDDSEVVDLTEQEVKA
jgi:uncharacterized membrane protein